MNLPVLDTGWKSTQKCLALDITNLFDFMYAMSKVNKRKEKNPKLEIMCHSLNSTTVTTLPNSHM